jgi:carbon monoxide dehydrogenase subunit G
LNVSGAANVHASQEPVRAALTDPVLLGRAVPGLDQIDFPGDGSCRFTMTIAIAAVSGTYAGDARVVERPESAVRVVRVSAVGVKGKIGADITIRLAPAADGSTELSYTADADVGGAIAGIGQRMLASIAKRIATDAFGGLDAVLAGPAPAEAPAATAAPARAAATHAAPGQDPAVSTGQAADTRGALGDSAVARGAIERARRGVGLRGERAPAIRRPAPTVKTGLIAGAAAAVTGIVIGVVLRKRRGRR